MNIKQTIFVNEYLKCWNASEAARRAGYNGKSNVAGSQLLANPSIQLAIKERVEEIKMSADEVLIRLAVMARSNMADFARVRDSDDVAKLGDAACVIKKFKKKIFDTPVGEREDIELELYDAQSALEKLGRHHRLFADNLEVSGPGGKPIEFTEVVVELPNDVMED